MNYQKKWMQAIEDEFEQQKKRWPTERNHHQKIRELQLKHFSLFLKTGLPSSKDLHWRFSNINSLLSKKPQPADSSSSSEKNKEHIFPSFLPLSHKIHFHNGVLIEDSVKKLPEGVQFCTWKNLNPDFPLWDWIINQITLNKKEDGFYHLAGALPTEGYILYIPKDNEISRPLHIHFSFDKSINSDVSLFPLLNLRNFIFLEEGAKATFIESVSTQTDRVINSSTSVKSSPHSSLKWLTLDQGQSRSFHLNQAHCNMQKSSCIDRLSFSLGCGLSRDIIKVYQREEQAKSILSGLNLLKDTNCRDQKFFIYHLAKEGYSRQLSRGVLNDKAKNIFHGKIHVSHQALQTDCAQSAKNLLLSPTADAYTQPELEINCGEVKAQHGATAGQMDKDEVFYLQTRGLNQKKAFELLLIGYMTDALSQFSHPYLVNQLIKNIQNNKSLYLNL